MISDSDIAERARHRQVRPGQGGAAPLGSLLPFIMPPRGGLPFGFGRRRSPGLAGLHHRRQAGYLPGRPAALAPLAVLVVEVAGQPVQVHPAGVASRHRAADLPHIDRQAAFLLCQTPAAPVEQGEGHIQAVPARQFDRDLVGAAKRISPVEPTSKTARHTSTLPSHQHTPVTFDRPPRRTILPAAQPGIMRHRQRSRLHAHPTRTLRRAGTSADSPVRRRRLPRLRRDHVPEARQTSLCPALQCQSRAARPGRTGPWPDLVLPQPPRARIDWACGPACCRLGRGPGRCCRVRYPTAWMASAGQPAGPGPLPAAGAGCVPSWPAPR
jgi:hypothetical protein